MQKYLILTLLLSLSCFAQIGSPTRVTDTDKIDSSRFSIIEILKDLEAQTTGAWTLPGGTDAQRPGTPLAGMIRYNSEQTTFEGYTDEWGPIAGAGGGLNKWVTGTEYEVDNVIWEPLTELIYRANTAHTASADFITDIANWDLLADSNTSQLNEDLIHTIDGTGKLQVVLDTRTYNQDPQIQHGNLIPNASFERDDLTNISCTDATASFEASELGGQNNQRQLTITSTDTDWSCDIVGAASEGQGVLKLATRATVTGSEYCALINSTEQLCKDIAVTGTMYTDWIYPTLGGTANSLRIKGATSGDVVKVDMVELQQQALGSISVDSDPVSYTPTFQGAGTVSGVNIKWARQGAFLVLDGYFTAGTVTADQARIGLPSGLVIDTGYAALTVFGSHNVDFETGVYLRTLMGVSGQSYLTFGGNFTPTSSLSSRNGNVIFVTGARVSIKARVPIQGWTSNTAAVTGRCIGFECVNEFSAKISDANAVSDQNVSGWISSVTGSGGVFTVNFASGLFDVAPNCTPVADGGASPNFTATITSETSSSVVVRTSITNTGGASAVDFVIDCQRSTDYKQQKEVKGVVGKDFVTGGVEVYTGDKWDGAEIYRRCFEVASDITAGGVIATIPANLNPVGINNPIGTNWYILNFTDNASSAAVSWIHYNRSTGAINAEINTFKIGAGVRFCLEYIK